MNIRDERIMWSRIRSAGLVIAAAAAVIVDLCMENSLVRNLLSSTDSDTQNQPAITQKPSDKSTVP